jgi:phosphatidylinositol-3-phosphatase
MPRKIPGSAPPATFRAARGVGSRLHLASALPKGRESPKVRARSGVIWRIPDVCIHADAWSPRECRLRLTEEPNRRNLGQYGEPQMLAASDRRLITGLTLALIGGASVTPQASATTWKPVHVVVVIEENHTYQQVLGTPEKPNPNTPCIQRLAKGGALFIDAHGVTHPSQLNYLALFAGTTLGIDCEYDKNGSLGHCLPYDAPLQTFAPDFYSKALPNLAAALIAKGYSFAGYSEGLPKVGSLLGGGGLYARKHNPWSNWQSDDKLWSNSLSDADRANLLKPSINRGFDSFPNAPEKFSTDLPTVAFVVPNVENDEHGDNRVKDNETLLKNSDDWLQTHIGPFAKWAKDNDSLLIVTWDEGYEPHNSIPLILYGAKVRQGQYPEKVTHYHVLRLIEDLYGLDPIGESAKVDPIRDVIP